MNLFLLGSGLFAILCASLVIMQACNGFEQSASYLGRNMGGGARGALIDAIGSSLPEVLVTLMFAASGNPELILAGISVTAGSAIFNIILIPAISILYAKDENGNKVKSFELSKWVLVRDTVFLLAGEALLIWFLGFSSFTVGMAAALLIFYVVYAIFVIYDSKRSGNNEVEEYEYESMDSTGVLSTIKNLDFNKLLFSDKPLTTVTAWTVLGISVLIIGVACHFLANGVEDVAVALGIPVYFSAVVLGAAATSVPDTILSVKSAQRGEAIDAVSNAVGSNIFDITVSLGLPLLICLLAYGGSVPIEQSTELLHLRWFVFVTSAIVCVALFLKAKGITKGVAKFLFGLYGIWIAYIIASLVW